LPKPETFLPLFSHARRSSPNVFRTLATPARPRSLRSRRCARAPPRVRGAGRRAVGHPPPERTEPGGGGSRYPPEIAGAGSRERWKAFAPRTDFDGDLSFPARFGLSPALSPVSLNQRGRSISGPRRLPFCLPFFLLPGSSRRGGSLAACSERGSFARPLLRLGDLGQVELARKVGLAGEPSMTRSYHPQRRARSSVPPSLLGTPPFFSSFFSFSLGCPKTRSDGAKL